MRECSSNGDARGRDRETEILTKSATARLLYIQFFPSTTVLLKATLCPNGREGVHLDLHTTLPYLFSIIIRQEKETKTPRNIQLRGLEAGCQECARQRQRVVLGQVRVPVADGVEA
jgi:hypothetical protein